MPFSAKKFENVQKNEIDRSERPKERPRMPEIEQWLEWKDKCALALCPSSTQASLRKFVHRRYCSYGRQYARTFHVGESELSSPDFRESWHWFESYFQLSQTREGKSYKEWLLARCAGRPALEAGDMESGVSLLLRDVVRDRLRSEYAPRQVSSLNTEADSAEDCPSAHVLDLLPDEFDTAAEVERGDIARIAADLADSALEALPHRERLALLGRELGLSLATPPLLKVAGCGKTALAKAHHAALAILANHVAAACPAEDRATLASLTVAVFDIVRKRIICWGKAENGLFEFLTVVEGVDGSRGPHA